MPKQSEIDRMIVLLYRSNNAHDFINFVRPAGWLEKLPLVGLKELREMLGRLQMEVTNEIAERSLAIKEPSKS